MDGDGGHGDDGRGDKADASTHTVREYKYQIPFASRWYLSSFQTQFMTIIRQRIRNIGLCMKLISVLESNLQATLKNDQVVIQPQSTKKRRQS
jgi:hypothetical protein